VETIMSYVREKFVSTGILVVGLCLSPVAFGQAQNSASAAAPAQNSGQAQTSGQAAQAPAKDKAPASAEPQLQDQSAPQDQSLGAVARQAKAQKAKSEPAKVYTEDKLAGLSGRGVSSVGSGNSGGGASYGGNSYNNAAASGGGGGQSLGSNESYWRGRANAIRGQMAQLDAQIAGIREEIKKKGAVTVDPMSGAAAGVIYVEDRNKQIQQVEAQKEKLQQSLDDLAEEGRKAGADSGWFR
jgi:hypothetical protein